MTLKEERQAAALRRLTKALDQHRRAEAEVRAAVAEARDAEVSVNRLATLAEVSRGKVYTWLKEATAAQERAPTSKRRPASGT